MYTPDKGIVRQIKAYDPDLYVKWNNQGEYWELWRKRLCAPDQRVTPVTPAIYGEGGGRKFAPLDHRILWWIYASDSWRSSPKKHALEADKRFQEFHRKAFQKRKGMYRDFAKDAWCAANNFFTSKYAPKDSGPKFRNYKKRNKFIRPDRKGVGKIYKRSRANAKALNFQK